MNTEQLREWPLYHKERSVCIPETNENRKLQMYELINFQLKIGMEMVIFIELIKSTAKITIATLCSDVLR